MIFIINIDGVMLNKGNVKFQWNPTNRPHSKQRDPPPIHQYLGNNLGRFEDIKGVIRSSKSKNKQQNGRKKKNKTTNNDVTQNIKE